MNKKVSLGQYYTPPNIARWMIDLADMPRSSRVLEPSFGEGVFLDQLEKLGYKDYTGYDVDPENFQRAEPRWKSKVRLQDFLEAPRDPVWNLVIGNPPYVRWSNLEKRFRKTLLEEPFWRSHSSGEWDLLYAFLLGGAAMLRPGGRLCFVVPCNWMTATYAAPVRKYLEDHGHFRDIVLFEEYRVFSDAAPNTMIFVWEKAKSKKPARVLQFQGKQKSNPLPEADRLRGDLLRGNEKQGKNWRAFHSKQPHGSWHLASSEDTDFADRVEAVADRQLSDAAEVGVGFVSGYDHAFEADPAWNLSSLEKQYLRPFVKARDCQHFILQQPSLFLFLDEIKTEKELRQLPNIYQHLLGHREKLEARWGHKQWWQWATVRNEDLFQRNLRRTKIFVPCTDRSRRARFSVTRGYYGGSGDVLLIAPRQDPWYLQAWLGSGVWNRWHQIRGPRTGERRRYGQSFMVGAPFLPPEKLSATDQKRLRRWCQELAREISLSRRKELLKKSDAIFDKSIS